jgi:hypothetical protein
MLKTRFVTIYYHNWATGESFSSAALSLAVK